ncbi:hypothetical protein L7F22_020113 [Adiantum nelumboides]|nr:hypothetical protein [Adiantum nelumboides]
MQRIPKCQEERDVQKAPGGQEGEGLREYPGTQERGAKQSIPPEHQEEKEEGSQKNPAGQEGEGNPKSQEGKGRERQKIPEIQEEKGVQKAPDDQERENLDKLKLVPPNAVHTTVQEKKLLLKLAQPPNFKGKGVNVERDAEVWLEAMDDYFEAVGTHPQNQTMLAMFRLTGNAKIWWKTHCRDSDIIGASQTWEQIKDAVTSRYLPPAHKTTKMNEFFSLRQISSTLEEYLSKFVTLRRYAPKMTLEQQVARFCQGLIEPLNNRLEALRPTNLQDALLRAKPLALEIQQAQQGRRNYLAKRAKPNNWNNQPANHAYQIRPIVATTAAIELPNVRCYECQEYGHYRNNCPRRTRASEANTTPVNAIARGQPNIHGGRKELTEGEVEEQLLELMLPLVNLM